MTQIQTKTPSDSTQTKVMCMQSNEAEDQDYKVKAKSGFPEKHKYGFFHLRSLRHDFTSVGYVMKSEFEAVSLVYFGIFNTLCIACQE